MEWRHCCFITLLSLILVEVVTCHSHSHGEAKWFTEPEDPRTLWIAALLSTALISAAPFFILFFIPLDNAHEHESLLKVLLSFASGGLLGDAFLHLIPHALSSHHSHHSEEEGHSHAHDHHHHEHDHTQEMSIGLWVLAGIIAFLLVEKLVRLMKGEDGGHSHGHTHHKNKPDKGKQDKKEDKDKSDNDKKKQAAAPSQDIKVAGYLNLAADFTHNFTDGLAIGASYLVNINVGIVTTATILIHEIPHEIGDFAILVQSGYPKRKAMFLQLSTATGAMVGTLVGLLADSFSSAATAWILPFTAGGFIYIATVSVIPELLENTSVGQSIKEMIAMCIGVLMMVGIAMIE